MALVFRINAISKTLTRYCRALTQSFLPYPRRSLFTNTCSIYFAKKKVDDLKIPKCPDFEQYFKKPTKEEVDKKTPINADGISTGKGNDKKKPPFQSPIFGDVKTTTTQPRPVTYKKNSITQPKNVDGQKNGSTIKVPTGNEKEPLILNTETPDKIQPSASTPQMSDKKGSAGKILKDFIDFTPPPRSSDKNNTCPETLTAEKDEKKTQSSTGDYSKTTKERGSEASIIDEKNNTRKSNYKWLAAVAAGLCGIGLGLLMIKSSTDGSSESIQSTEVIEQIRKEKINEIEMGQIKEIEKEQIKEIKQEPIMEIKEEQIKCPLALPKKVPYLIIGGGTASWSAFKAIKERVSNAKVLIVSNETHPPYMRPPLSKLLWLSDKNKQVDEIYKDIFLEPSDFYTDPMDLLSQENGGVSILYNRTAKSIKLCERKVILNDGTEIEYDQCLIATGSRPRNLLIFQSAPIRIRNKISFFRNLNDFKSVKEIVGKSESIAVIGGGFLATEISLALAKYGTINKKLQVYQIFHENGNMGMTLPRYLSDWVKKKLTDHGLSIISNTQVDSVEMENAKLKLGLLDGKLVVVDHVIVALGSKPDVAFAEKSGLKISSKNNGIVVKKNLEALPHLYVAGDAACLPESFGKETETSYDHAEASGRLAGENMTGNNKSFDHQSMFWSTVCPEISFESVGLIDSALKTVGVFFNGSDLTTNIDNTNKGVIFYIKHDKVVGIVLWNVSNKINVARQVIAEGKKLYDLNEVAQRFEIQE